MSEKLCTLRTKGGGGAKYTETSLWTNPNPTSSSGFVNQTVNLSEGLSNFKYIGIKYAYDYARTTDSNCVTTDIISVTDFTKSKNDTSYRKNFFMLGAGMAGVFERIIYYTNDTQIYVGAGVAISSGSVGTNNTICIPLEILGLNELDTGKMFDETTLWTNNAPTSSWNTDPISLNDDISNYDYIKIVCRKSNISADECQVLCPVSEFKTYSTSDGYGLSATIYVSSYYYTRRFRYGSNTQVIVNNCYKYSASSGTTSAISLLPIRIVGCKFR